MKPIWILLVALAACSSNKAPTPTPVVEAKADDEPKMFCTKEKPTGSLRPVTICRSTERMEKTSADAKELLDNIRHGPESQK